jgi:hypothetical protein
MAPKAAATDKENEKNDEKNVHAWPAPGFVDTRLSSDVRCQRTGRAASFAFASVPFHRIQVEAEPEGRR